MCIDMVGLCLPKCFVRQTWHIGCAGLTKSTFRVFFNIENLNMHTYAIGIGSCLSMYKFLIYIIKCLHNATVMNIPWFEIWSFSENHWLDINETIFLNVTLIIAAYKNKTNYVKTSFSISMHDVCINSLPTAKKFACYLARQLFWRYYYLYWVNLNAVHAYYTLERPPF